MTIEAQLLTALPELEGVADPEDRRRIESVWSETLANAGWALDEAPAFLDPPHRPNPDTVRTTLVEHTRHVLWMVDEIATVCEAGYGFVLDRASLVAAALVHDVGKLLAYEWSDGKVRRTPLGRDLPMSYLSAAAAREAGLSVQVQKLVLTADPEGQLLPDTREASLLAYAKLVTLDVARLKRNEPLWVARR